MLLVKLAPVLGALTARSTLPSSTFLQRSFAVSVDVRNNNVDQAWGRLRRLCKESGLDEDLKKNEYHLPGYELRAQRKLNKHNQKVGAVIKDRLRWLTKKKKIRF